MKLKYILLILTTTLFIQCNNSANDKSGGAKDSCCVSDSTNKNNEIAMQSEITCPECGHKKMETMPTDVCLIKYNCEKCNAKLRPKDGDCCVFCSYGTHKCPSMQ